MRISGAQLRATDPTLYPRNRGWHFDRLVDLFGGQGRTLSRLDTFRLFFSHLWGLVKP